MNADIRADCSAANVDIRWACAVLNAATRSDDVVATGWASGTADAEDPSKTTAPESFDGSSTISDPNNSDVDTLWLKDVLSGEVSYSYQGKTLVLTINSTSEQITVQNFYSGVTSLSYFFSLKPYLFPKLQEV